MITSLLKPRPEVSNPQLYMAGSDNCVCVCDAKLPSQRNIFKYYHMTQPKRSIVYLQSHAQVMPRTFDYQIVESTL